MKCSEREGHHREYGGKHSERAEHITRFSKEFAEKAETAPCRMNQWSRRKK